jgi:hypothetical protein
MLVRMQGKKEPSHTAGVSRGLMIHWSTETALRRLLFQKADFYSNTFTWHFPMDPKACLCYPSQPVYSDLPPRLAHPATLSQPMRGL